MEKTGQLIARIFLAQIFLLSGIFKIGGYAGTQGYMEAMGVPGMLLPLVIALEIGGGLATDRRLADKMDIAGIGWVYFGSCGDFPQ